MAYAATISLMQSLQQILLHPQRYSIPCDKKHIESFHGKLEFLQRFLEEHPSTKSNDEVSSLDRRIRDAVYESEDFMDIHLSGLSNSEEMMGRIDIELMMKKVDSIIEEVTEVKEQMGLEIKQGRGSSMEEEIKIGEVRTHEDSEPRNALRKDSSQLVSSDRKNLMVGFDDHLIQIKDQLKGESSELEVVSIVGMGGIGKTTLATHVYKDLHCENHFDICAWATVSQSYSLRDILLGMLRSMKILTKEMLQQSADQLRLRVYQKLKDRRYLIMIDDIWDTNAWDHLKMTFPDDKISSRIMLTTRIADVAAYAASPSGANLTISLLNNDQSWTLLCAEGFGDEPCPPNFEEIGKAIAHNCQGLPLSIAVVGRLLSKVERTQVAWQSIAENVTSFVFSSDAQCSEILRLSYNYLPQYLKACFLYMGVFPKSYEIHVSKLTQMWVAEGFLRQDHGRSSEEVAESCVEDLLDRSLILMSKKNSEGKIKAFRIHDLLHDFCIKEAKYEKFLQVAKGGVCLSPTNSTSARRISIHPVEVLEHSQFPFNSISSTSYVRSLVCVGQCSLCSSVFLRFKLLRVLDVTQVEFLEFPSQVLELLNLRYIALICNGDIPASITMLCNLQTLIIVRNWSPSRQKYLPVEIWTMAHLRHVRCDEAQLLDPSAAKFDIHRRTLVLEDLQSLSGLWNLVFTEELLQRIPNIEKIDVEYESRYLEKWSDYQLENLGSLHQLKTLKIGVVPCLRVLINLFRPSRFRFRFPTSLKTLILGGVGIPWHDLATIGSLPNLEVLKLINCACLGTEWKPNEGEFCGLKVLVLERLKLTNWEADYNHFPSLQRLTIRWCYGLVNIPSGMGDSPTLTMIELRGCKDSVFTSANEILEKQRSYRNDDFQVIVDDKKRIHSINHVIEELLGLPSIFG